MPTDFHVFRHGETDWNAAGRFQGRVDVPLNDAGRAQADALAQALGPVRPELIVSSTLVRARETAEILSRSMNIPVEFAPGLEEISFGASEGRTLEEVRRSVGEDFWERWRNMDEEHLDEAHPGGETKRSALTRARRALERCASSSSARTIAVCTHGAILRFLIHSLLDPRVRRIEIPNCRIFHFTFEASNGTWRFHEPSAPCP